MPADTAALVGRSRTVSSPGKRGHPEPLPKTDRPGSWDRGSEKRPHPAVLLRLVGYRRHHQYIARAVAAT
jgi:hypothetical protein